MELSEAKQILKELRGRFDSPYSSSDKSTIEDLYFEVLGKTFRPTSCQQCYHDAVIEMYCYIKKNNSMAEKSNYRLKAGVIINCPNFQGGKIYTNDNLTDKVASDFLKMFPEQVSIFQKVPAEKPKTPKNGNKKAEKPKTPKNGGKVDEPADSKNPEEGIHDDAGETPTEEGVSTDGSDGDGVKEGDENTEQ